MYFAEMVKRLTPKLKGITHRLNGRFTFFNENDLYQEAMVHLWIDYKDGKLTEKTDSYILQGCYFYLKNYIRKTHNKASLISLENMVNKEGEMFDLDDIFPLEHPESTFELINSRMIIEKINNNVLTEKEKSVFCLALEGLTTREIGARLGISHVRVVKLKGKIRDKCRKYRELL